jgi:uncharacterized Fe-S cluster protein YjdI
MEKNNREYTNGEITVSWQPKKCIHATICYVELISVFNPRKRPWVNMDGAPSDKIIEIVDKCPTDALTYRWNKDIEGNGTDSVLPKQDTEVAPAASRPVEIRIMKDGPIVITGKVSLTDNDGKAYKTYSITSICRCGESGNLPFCDGTHRKIGFTG